MGVLGMAYVVFYVIFYGLLLLLSVACYIMNAVALSTIAKRRGLDKPWAAWIPVGDAWTIGRISDQYRQLAYGEYSERGRDLLKHGIMLYSSLVVFCLAALVLVIGAALSAVVAPLGMLFIVLGYILLIAAFVFLMVVDVRYCIRYYKALFDLYRSCMPKMPIAFLLLSMLVTYALPVCLMICRNKDDGMPLPEEPISEEE